MQAAPACAGRVAVGREDGDLAEVALVRLDQLGERLHRRCSAGEQLEPARAVAPLGERLRRHRADPRERPGTEADAERARLYATPSSPLFSSRPTIEYVVEASLCNLGREGRTMRAEQTRWWLRFGAVLVSLYILLRDRRSHES